jgi:hypothetical protein
MVYSALAAVEKTASTHIIVIRFIDTPSLKVKAECKRENRVVDPLCHWAASKRSGLGCINERARLARSGTIGGAGSNWTLARIQKMTRPRYPELILAETPGKASKFIE